MYLTLTYIHTHTHTHTHSLSLSLSLCVCVYMCACVFCFSCEGCRKCLLKYVVGQGSTGVSQLSKQMAGLGAGVIGTQAVGGAGAGVSTTHHPTLGYGTVGASRTLETASNMMQQQMNMMTNTQVCSLLLQPESDQIVLYIFVTPSCWNSAPKEFCLPLTHSPLSFLPFFLPFSDQVHLMLSLACHLPFRLRLLLCLSYFSSLRLYPLSFFPSFLLSPSLSIAPCCFLPQPLLVLLFEQPVLPTGDIVSLQNPNLSTPVVQGASPTIFSWEFFHAAANNNVKRLVSFLCFVTSISLQSLHIQLLVAFLVAVHQNEKGYIFLLVVTCCCRVSY